MKLAALMGERELKGKPPPVPDTLGLQNLQIWLQIPLFGYSDQGEVCKKLERVTLEGEDLESLAACRSLSLV